MQQQLKKDKQCYFCVNNLKEVDYKDAQLLRRFLNSYAKILPKKRTGVCSKHQRKVALAVKRARILALVPFLPR
ncbi:30S ribosomal protein S18 [Candidatus Falkowbacteria bacterium RIFCSPLOWO2_12_FULL_45_10]|uniref:Small ribosomal subunit protein bS18 n=3 Tax=Candidatus Falkowiibacteriota TaxID=1752728 RepID=A0A1F5RZ00_9BACT|nr:MAG: 30S ribosomal protein S18 [Candidatus Falkowbacteria bacterium RIFCSPLOWO2_12_FULL_45_10]OGF19648.1 MAG: 30S ribosomal protein S18 [Candidatus Falkowbacteria bacterium RIFCSPHIGHO2_02_FULL_45_15]OGF20011.1 MAG: 30S ribosomal protein S18 [Candidatus Falkowbacteria bacterium RIFCSPLOWO2_02_FULL_45_15]